MLRYELLRRLIAGSLGRFAFEPMISDLQYRILKTIRPQVSDERSSSAYSGKSKLQTLLGDKFLRTIQGKTVLDFGCGGGAEAVEMALAGTARVIGLDIREEVLGPARERALRAGLAAKCSFAISTEERADVVVSLDAFEHFADPAAILQIMNELLVPGGEVFISFGPTWYHPLGGHLFSVFPWAHLLFREEALIRWRSDFKTDGATRFHEVAGGLNGMTIRRFAELVQASHFRLTSLELVPIRKLRLFHNRLTREFTTAIVRCQLTKTT